MDFIRDSENSTEASAQGTIWLEQDGQQEELLGMENDWEDSFIPYRRLQGADEGEISFDYKDGIKWSAKIDMITDEIVMKTTLPNKSWFSIGFGPNMRGTDMIVWRWKDDEMVVDNVWSTTYNVPPSDGTDYLKTTIQDSTDGKFKTFTTRRALDTGNVKDFVIQTDKSMAWSYALRTGKGTFSSRNDIHTEREIFDVKFSSSGGVETGTLDLTSLRRNDFYEAHGYWLWTVWMPVGFLMLVTKRYAKKHWSCCHIIHALFGVAILFVTLLWTFKILDYFEWTVNTDLHSIMGITSAILCLIVTLSGAFTAALQQFYEGDKAWTAKEKQTRIGKFHRYSGYFMLFIGNLTVFLGIQHYYGDIVMDDNMAPLGLISLLTFCMLVILFECNYRRSNSRASMVVETPPTTSSEEVVDGTKKTNQAMVYSSQQIERGVAAGIPLLIFDNLVLNLNGYEKMHPGGKFVLKQNFGRDVSKFFNGGYSLIQGPGIKPHHHSAHALKILKGLIVGVLEKQHLVKEEMFRISNKERVTDATFTFTFTQKDNGVVHNLKRWYSDLGMMGRHFLVSSKRFSRIKRHYTICSCMRPELLEELIKLSCDALSGNEIKFNMSLLNNKDQEKICLTLKNYKFIKGVSTQIHGVVPVLDAPEDIVDLDDMKDANTSRNLVERTVELNSPTRNIARDRIETYNQSPKIYLPSEAAVMAQTVNAVATETGFNLQTDGNANAFTGQMRPIEEMFNIKGPMGRGLDIQKNGLHIAFCAGTGVLVFLDLVAHLVMRNVFLSKLAEDKVDPQFKVLKNDFEFHLYVAFQDMDSSIGIQLCEALERINERFHYKNFKLTIRLSEDIYAKKKPARWDEKFIDAELTPHAGKIKKVWVCGPPILNQTFDMVLSKNKEKFKLQTEQIEIL